VAIVFSLVAAALPAEAQRVYVGGGWTEAYRDPAAPQLDPVREPQGKSLVPGLSGAVGVWLANRLALESGVTFFWSQSFPWNYSYLLSGGDPTSEVASHGDMPIIGALRAVALQSRAVGLDIVAGGGISVHRASSQTVARCPYPGPATCTPVTPFESDSRSSWEPAVMVGVDAPIRVARRVALVPSFRTFAIARREWLTTHEHRGPASGGGVMTTFGVGLMIGRRFD
jgi:hypothetical protein